MLPIALRAQANRSSRTPHCLRWCASRWFTPTDPRYCRTVSEIDMRMITGMILLVAIWGCRAPTATTDLMRLYIERMGQLGDIIMVPTPEHVPEDAGEKDAYLDGFGDGYHSGMTGIEIAPLLSDTLPYRSTHIRGWYDGQRKGMSESPWKTEILREQKSTEPAHAGNGSTRPGERR
jgi:hypothetical protein